MRGALIHVLTGLLLGIALAGLLHAPTQLVAQQEAREPVVAPNPSADPGPHEQTVRLSPKLEQALDRQRERLARPKPVVRADAPAPRPASVNSTTPTPAPPVPSPP